MTDDLRGGNAPLSHEQAGRVGRDTPNAHGPAQRLLSDEELADILARGGSKMVSGYYVEDEDSAPEFYSSVAITGREDIEVLGRHIAALTAEIADRDALIVRQIETYELLHRKMLAIDEGHRARISRLEAERDRARDIAVALEAELAEIGEYERYPQRWVTGMDEPAPVHMSEIMNNPGKLAYLPDDAAISTISGLLRLKAAPDEPTVAPIADRTLDTLLGYRSAQEPEFAEVAGDGVTFHGPKGVADPDWDATP